MVRDFSELLVFVDDVIDDFFGVNLLKLHMNLITINQTMMWIRIRIHLGPWIQEV